MSSFFMVLSMIAWVAAIAFLIAGTIRFMDAPRVEPGSPPPVDERAWFRRRRYLLATSAGVAVLFLIVSVATTDMSGPSDEEFAQSQQDALHDQEQSWEAMGYDGAMPKLDAATVALRASEVVILSDKIMMEGSSPADCTSLGKSYEALFMAEFPDAEQQSYLDALTASLSQAISGCEDGRWQDAMVDVVESGILANAYTTKFTR